MQPKRLKSLGLCMVMKLYQKRQYRNWFDKFRFSNFFFKNKSRSGRPNKNTNDQIKTIIYLNLYTSLVRIVKRLNVSHTKIENYLKYAEYIKKNSNFKFLVS